jgi:hypothetical protein
MRQEQNLPVVVPSSMSTALTPAQAFALADLWVSEHNRLPFQFPTGADIRLQDGGGWRRSRRTDLVDLAAVLSAIAVALANLLSRGIHLARRLVLRRVDNDGFGLDGAVQDRLRRAFRAALADPRVRAMPDAEQRRHLGEVLFAAQGPMV